MHPVLVILHDRVLYAYWFFYGLGLLVSAATALWLSSRRGLPFWKIWFLCLVLIIAAFVGARTLSLIEHGLPYSEFLNLTEGGETSLGGILAAGVSAVTLSLCMKLPICQVLDILTPAIFFEIAVHRVGCFLNGCCYGIVSNNWFALRFPKQLDMQGDICGSPCFLHHFQQGLAARSDLWSLPVVPTQLISLVLSLIVGIAATVLVIRRKWEGRVLWICLGIHAILHFCLQWFRVVPNGDAFVVTWNNSHAMNLLIVAVSVAVLVGLRTFLIDGTPMLRKS